MTDLASWTRADFSDGGRTFPTYRKGTGPGVVIVHEIPGITPAVTAFGDEVVGAGFTVVMPSLFGTPGAPVTVINEISTFARLGVRSEFTKLGLQQTAPIADWLRALARALLRYAGDKAVGTRFDTLRRELGDKFIAVEFPGRKHSTLTEHRQQEGVDRVLDFLRRQLTE
jgi:dienelactone hydrolase